MLSPSSPTPTTAERIRSACARAGGALLALETVKATGRTRQDPIAIPVHHLLPDGSFALALPVDSVGQAACLLSGAQALLELTDYAPLPAARTGAFAGVGARPPAAGPARRGDRHARPDRRRASEPGVASGRDPEIDALCRETPGTRCCGSRSPPSSSPMPPAPSPSAWPICSPLGPTRSARSSRACCGIWTPSITTWSRGWCRNSRRHCDGGSSPARARPIRRAVPRRRPRWRP